MGDRPSSTFRTRWPGAVVMLLVGCATSGGQSGALSSSATPSAVLTALVADLRRTVAPTYRRPDRSDVEVRLDSSRVVRGLRYYWGFYDPPGTTHVEFRSVVATRRGTVVTIRTPSDWARAAAGWAAESPKAALAACQEIVHVTEERRFPPAAPPPVYRGPGSLRGARVRNVEELEAKLSSPAIEPALQQEVGPLASGSSALAM